MAVSVEKANSRLGVIILKCLAFHPDTPDDDGDIVDAESMEAAFYDFMARDDGKAKADFEHKTDVPGKVVAGWCFPQESLFRIAFKPDDPEVVALAEQGDIVGTSFGGTAERIPL